MPDETEKKCARRSTYKKSNGNRFWKTSGRSSRDTGKNPADRTTKGENSASENRKGARRDHTTASNACAVSIWQNVDCCIFPRGEAVGRDTGRQRTVRRCECIHLS